MYCKKNFITFCFITILVIGCGTTKLPCERYENGRLTKEYVVVQKHPEKQYLQIVQTTNTNIKTSIDILNKIKLSTIDFSTQRNIIELREKLDQFNIGKENILKGSYNSIQTYPCDTFVRRAHARLLEDMNKRNFALESLKVNLNALSNSGGTKGNLNSNNVQNILNKYVEESNDTTVHFNQPSSFLFDIDKSPELLKYYQKSRGWFFDKEVNGNLRVNNSSLISGYSSSMYYPVNEPLLMDSLDLNRDFIIEARVRSLNPDYMQCGLMYDGHYYLNDYFTYLLNFNKENNTVSLVAGKYWKGGDQEFEKTIFQRDIKADILQFHKLQVKKSGEVVSFFFDSKKIFETVQYRIETNKVKLFVGLKSDALVDYMCFYY